MILPGLSHLAIGRPRRADPTAFAGSNVSYASVAELGRAMALATGLAGNATAGGTLSINSLSLGSYDYAIKNGNQSVSSGFTVSDWFTATQDSRSAFVAVKGDLTINAGAVFTPSVRKLFTVIYVTGNLVVNGEISMTARGANHSSTGSNITARDIRVDVGTFGGVTNPTIPAAGAAGGPSQTTVPSAGIVGSTGVNGQSGGGGSGGVEESGASGDGAAGTSFSGGPGGGGTRAGGTNAANDGQANGGRGGDAYLGNSVGNRGVSAGAGNPGGSNAIGSSGSSIAVAQSGTGGTLLIFVEGNITGTGTISSKGSNGGVAQFGGNGAGSGGGAIDLLCGTFSGPTVTSDGGIGGSNTGNLPDAGRPYYGGNGGAGSKRTMQGWYW